MEQLRKKRAALKRQLTMFSTYVNKIYNEDPNARDKSVVIEIKQRLTKVESVYDKFNEVQLEIDMEVIDDGEDVQHEVQEFENTYFRSVALAQTIIETDTDLKAREAFN